MIGLIIYLLIGCLLAMGADAIMVWNIKHGHLDELREKVEYTTQTEFRYNHEFVDTVRIGEYCIMMFWPAAIALWLYHKHTLNRRD